jgi:RNA polymerase sigma-70 factor (ECF subfamily)
MSHADVQPESPLERAMAGDRDAFAELVETHQHEVYTLALRLTRDPHLANDVAQESFIKAWRALPKFRGDAAFGTWVHRITVNTAWTLRNRAGRHQHDELGPASERPSLAAVADPVAAGENAELRRVLDGALDALPAGQRTVVVLKDVHGYSHDEIADALDISVSASKVRLHRAHLRLRRVLAALDEDVR